MAGKTKSTEIVNIQKEYESKSQKLEKMREEMVENEKLRECLKIEVGKLEKSILEKEFEI